MATVPRHTRDAIAALRTVVGIVRTKLMRLDASHSAKAVAQLGAAESASAAPPEPALDAARRRLLAAALAPAGLDGAERRDIRHAPWLMWNGAEPLGGLSGLLELVVQRGSRSASTRRNLVEAWMRGFAAGAPRIGDGGQAIRLMLADAPDLRLERWRVADRAYELFDATQGPRNVAEAILRGREPVEQTLRRTGLDEPLRGVGGYARAVQDKLLGKLPGVLREGKAEPRGRLSAFLAPNGSVRFDDVDTKGRMARACLSAWLDGQDPPSEAARADVQAFLLRHLKDPRVHPENWRGAGPESIERMRKWLGAATFSAFFELISEFTPDKRWPYRRAFWSAYLKDDKVDDIWVALGKRLRDRARSITELADGYADLEGDDSQAVLLMRVGDIIFSEWSDIGKLRAVPHNMEGELALYQKKYSSYKLKSVSLSFRSNSLLLGGQEGLSHMNAENGSWQRKAAAFITARVGVRQMALSELMPHETHG